MGTKVHAPYSTGAEVGTVTGVHRRKAGVVCVEYLDDSQLYEVARGLLFSTTKGAQEHLDRVRKGKGEPTPPHGLQGSLTLRLTPCLTPTLTPDKRQKLTPRLTQSTKQPHF